jgi:hypothetical protein
LNVDDIIISFLRANSGKAFTPESLVKRIEGNFQNPDQLKYFQKNTQGLLNRLTFSFKINTEEYNGTNYYFIE